MTDIEWTEKAIDLLNGLEQENQQRLISKLEEAQDWTSHRLDKLSGYPYYKLRAGDYRAIITWDQDQDVLIVEAVGHRRNIYDRHLPP
jgi:mRNA interferase RelE/StbE